jgi:hypothetical protein
MKSFICYLMVICAVSCVGASAASDATLPIGLDKQLLVDDHTIAERQNVRRVLGQVTKANGGQPVMVADKPWEDDICGFYGTVLHDGQKFRMWYHPWAYAVAYAESDDGLHWRKPTLNMYDFSVERAQNKAETDAGFSPREGAPLDWRGKQNNIIGFFGDGFTCFLDPHETDPAHRYKACYGQIPKICACLAHSPDGIHWTPYNKGEPVTGRASDTYNQLLWDEDAKTYRLLTRTDCNRDGAEIRGSRVMVNPDVKGNPTAWKTVREWCFDREGPNEFQRRQIYGMTDWIYEGIHFGLMMVFEWPDETPGQAPQVKTDGIDHYKRHDRDVMEFYIAPCRDGANWNLDWVYAGKPLVPRGPDGSFDKDMIVPCSSIVTWQDKHWIYYSGCRERHWRVPSKSSIGLATLPLDRFAGLQATDQKAGIVTTKRFKLAGSRLTLNADASRGAISVEVLDQDGRPIDGLSAKDCRPMQNVDGLRLPVHWQNPHALADLKGRVVCLRFTLQNGTLYAFQIQP